MLSSNSQKMLSGIYQRLSVSKIHNPSLKWAEEKDDLYFQTGTTKWWWSLYTLFLGIKIEVSSYFADVWLTYLNKVNKGNDKVLKISISIMHI